MAERGTMVTSGVSLFRKTEQPSRNNQGTIVTSGVGSLRRTGQRSRGGQGTMVTSGIGSGIVVLVVWRRPAGVPSTNAGEGRRHTG